MPIRVTCPNCDAAANIEEQSLGKRGRCKKCGHVFALARPDGDAASAVSGDASAWKKGSSEPASPTNLPEQFGRYRIIKQLGQGGMGAVYLAHDTKLEREVALKVPYFSPAEGPQAVQRFEREARAAATLDHPNLCPIHDVGEFDGIHYLTMPYIKGKTLSEVMGLDQTFTENQAAAITLKLAQALQEAHENGIIHRDLKPGNIMVNRRRELIVMDFGLARMAGGEERNLTKTGHVVGTALYMAPEQAAGDLSAVGPQADVYSLGVILYELLTGRPPFDGPWGLVIGLKNVKDPDPPSKHRTSLSPSLDAICHKAIAKEPKDRYASMNELAAELGAFLKSAATPILTPSGTVMPEERPESLAAKAFTGKVDREVSGLEKSQPGDLGEAILDGEPRRPSRRQILVIAGVAAFLILGVIGWLIVGRDETAPESAFVPLPFPKDFSGWKKWGRGITNWEVSDDGVLTMSAEGDSDAMAMLFTIRDDYRNFRLRFDVLSPDDIRKAVSIRATVDEANHTKSSYHVLVAGTSSPLDQRSDTIGSIHAFHNADRDAGVRDWEVPARKVPTPTGEWQSIEIEAIDRRITTRVGGRKVAEFVDDKPGCEVGGIYLGCLKSSVKFKNMRIQEIHETDFATQPAINLNAFHVYGGEWTVVGEELHQINNENKWTNIAFGDPRWVDYDFSVDLMRVSGIACAMVNARNRGRNNYSLHLDALIDSVHKNSLGAWVSKSWEQSVERDWVGIDNHKWYHVRFRVRGSLSTVTVDHEGTEILKLELDNSTIKAGCVSLGGFGAIFRFKNIEVTDPDGRVLWKGLPAIGAGIATAGAGIDLETP